jgi:Asp-tRNA(Asn)/Glu-tRNA(Gln) amidotransferase C subunit
LSAAAILVLFECLEHPEWQIQKDAIMRLKRRAARDVVRETLIKHAVGLPDTPAVSSRHDPMIFPAKSFTRRDREIVKTLGVLVREKLEVVGDQVQNCCPAELAMKALGAQWCQTTLKHRNPEVFLAVAMVSPTLGQKHIQGCFAALQRQQEGDWRAETAQSLATLAVNQIKNLSALQTAGHESGKNVAELNDVRSLFESVISALAKSLESLELCDPHDEPVRDSIKEAFTSFWTAFDEFDEKLGLQQANVGLVFDAREPAESSSANASIAAMKTSLLQCCLQRCIAVLKSKSRTGRGDSVTLLGTFAVNQIKNLAAALQLTGNEADKRVARLNDVPSMFESVISALADTLHDTWPDVRDRVHSTFENLWTAFHKFDETLRLQKTQFGQLLDSGEPAESSSAIAPIAALKCSLLQCCLQRCFSDLKTERWVIRLTAVCLLDNFARNQIKNLSSALQISWLESSKQHVASLKDLQSEFQSVISALADTQGDRNAYVRGSVHRAFESFWIALKELEENLALKETNFEQISDCPSTSFASAPIVSLLSVKDSLLKVCQQSCLAGFQASNYRVRREALEMLFKTNQALSKALESIQTIRVSSALSWLESTVPSVVKMLGDKKATVRRALIDALSSCLSVLAKLSERCESVLLKVSNLEVCSDCPERADSQASASITTLKASLVQSCLKGCIVALKDKDWHTRLAAAVVIRNFAAGNVSSFIMAVQDPEMAAGLSDALSTCKAIVSELGKKGVEHVEEAIRESWVRIGLDAGACADSTDAHCGFGHPDSSSGSLDALAIAKSFAELKAEVVQRCLQACSAALKSKRWRIRQEAARLLGTFAENQIKNLPSAPGSIGNEATTNMAKLDAPALFESVISALAGALGDVDPDVQDTAYSAYRSLWIAFDKFEKRLTPQADNVGQVSDVRDPANCSSATASHQELNAAMFQCCLQRCFSELKNGPTRAREMVARLIGILARNQIKNLASALGTSPGKALATTAKLHQLPSLFASVVSALAGALDDQ